jgi:hypothetical protein
MAHDAHHNTHHGPFVWKGHPFKTKAEMDAAIAKAGGENQKHKEEEHGKEHH